MALLASVVTVAATPTQLNTSRTDAIGGSSLAVKVPTGGATVFVGGAAVTAASGWPIAAGESLFLDIDERAGGASQGPSPDEAVYAIVASGTQSVNVLARGI